MAKGAVKRRKPQGIRKGAVIGVRCTDSQKASLEEKAKRRGLGRSHWLLQLGLTQPDDPTAK